MKLKSQNHYPGIPPEITDQITYHAQRLKCMHCFLKESLEDIEQMLLVEVWSSLPKFNPNKSVLSTYVDKILHHRSCNLIRHQLTQKRGMRRDEVSLGHFYEEGRHPMKDILSERAHYDLQQLDRLADLDWIMSILPDQKRTLCQALKNNTISELATLQGRSRAAIYREVELISQQFESVNGSNGGASCSTL